MKGSLEQDEEGGMMQERKGNGCKRRVMRGEREGRGERGGEELKKTREGRKE